MTMMGDCTMMMKCVRRLIGVESGMAAGALAEGLSLGVAAALMLCAGQAAADDLPAKSYIRGPATDVTAPNWNGFYFGVGVGGGAVALLIDNSDEIAGRGAFGTFTVGYDRVIRPGWVAGVFTDFDFSGITFRELETDLDHVWSIGGRLGFLTNPSTLV